MKEVMVRRKVTTGLFMNMKKGVVGNDTLKKRAKNI
jgi:hypothetical protein